MRKMSAGTLCAVIIVCLSLTSVASQASLEDGVNSGWGTATLIESDDTGDASVPQVAVDGSGNAIAVWQQMNEPFFSRLWSNRYVVGTGWGDAQLIETDDLGSAGNPQVAVDGSGDATAVWYQSDGFRNYIWSNRYVVGTGWGTATHIGTDDGFDSRFPQVAVDASGNAIAVWAETGYIVWGETGIVVANIWSNRYVVDVGWGDAQLIETDDGSASDPQVAVDASGNAIAVWRQYDGASYNISSNRYVVGVGWGDAQLIETEDGNASVLYYSLQVAIDGSGNAIAVWSQDDGTSYSIWSNRYVVGVGWGDAQLIETDDGRVLFPQVAVDGSGNAIAVWSQDDGTSYSIWSNRYEVGSGWGTATLIETDDSGGAWHPQVTVDGSGDAIAVWHQFNGTLISDSSHSSIWSNRYVVGVGWGNAALIGISEHIGRSPPGFSDMRPQVAVDASGNAIAVWPQFDGTDFNIWSNRYVEPDSTPSSLSSTIAVFVVVAVVVSIVFFGLRKKRKTADRSSKSIEDEEPPHS